MSDDAKTATGKTEESKKPAGTAGKPKGKKDGDTDAAPISQAVPPVVRRPRAKAVAGVSSDAPAETPKAADTGAAAAKAPPPASSEASKPSAEGATAKAAESPGGSAATSGPGDADAQSPPKASAPKAKVVPEGPAAALARKAAEAKAAAAKAAAEAGDVPGAPIGEKAAGGAKGADGERGADAEGSADPSGGMTVTAADLDAEIQAAQGSSARKARKTRAVRTTESSAAGGDAGDETTGGEASSEAEGEGGPARRPRRERGRGAPEGDGGRARGPGRDRGERAPGSRGPGDRGRGPGSRGPGSRGPGSRGPGDRSRGERGGRDRTGPRDDAGGGGAPAMGLAAGRRIYRQDVAPHVAAAQAEAQRKAAEAERRRLEKESQDKITLILHPAPKASKTRRKKKERPLTAKEALQAKTAAKAKGEKNPKSESAAEAAPAAARTFEPSWLEATADSAGSALHDAGANAEELVKAWMNANNVAALARAAQLETLGSKPRKAARRALNILKSRGVEVPKLEAASPVAKSGEAEEIVAMFIPPDSTGSTFFSISQRQPGGRYHVVDVVVRPQLGVVHANSAKLAGKHIRGWQQRVEQQYGTKPVQVPIDWARHLIAEGRKQNDVSKQLVPLGYDNCAALLAPVPSEAPGHPVADLLSDEPSKLDLDKAIAESDALHGEPEFGSWMPDRPALDELLAKVGERVGPDGVKDSDKVDDAIRAEVAAATDRWFTPERRATLANSMQDCAISLRARHGDQAARRVVVVAKAVSEAGLITAPPSEIPFLLYFFRKAIAFMVRQNQGQLRVPIPAQP